MNKQIIPHVFGSLQTLERSLAELDDANSKVTVSKETREQYSGVLKNMRRVANKLQFEVASENWVAAVRSLKIFYGLHHMIRPDLLAALQNVRREREGVEISVRRVDEVPHHMH